MIGKSIFLGIFILMLASIASAAGNLTMSSPAAITILSGNSASSTFNMQNLANSTLSVTLSAVSPNVPISFNVSSLNLDNLSTQTVRVTANAVAVNAGTYTATIVASHEGMTTNSSLSITVRSQQTVLNIPSSVYLGSSSGQAINQSVTGSFTISNGGISGDKTLTGMEISTNAASKYNVTFSLDNTNFASTVSGFSLNPGESRTIYYKGFVPADTASGNIDIGDITVKSNEITQTITSFMINVEGKLKFYDINVDVDDERDSSIDVTGDDISKKAAPGSVVKIEMKLENLFTDDDDIDIEDITITGDIPDMESDDIDDFEEETSSFKINADSKSDWKYLTFEIPYDVEEGSYDIVIEAEGEDDEHGSTQRASVILTLDVEKEPHFIKIIKAKLGSEDITCKDYTTLNVQIQNIGSDDEDETVLTVKNAALGLLYTSEEMELVEDVSEDDNEFSKVFTIDLSKKNLSSGVYPIEVKTYYSGDILSDTQTVSLTVSGCEPEPEEKEEIEDKTVVLEEEAANAENQGGAVAQEVYETPAEKKEGLFSGNSYVMLLVLANIVIIIVAVFLVAKFLMKPRN